MPICCDICKSKTQAVEHSSGAPDGRDDAIGFGAQWGNYGDWQTGLQILGHRYYDPSTGRFLNRDPIGYQGGINLYGYAVNNPVNYSDPDGQRPVTTADRLVLRSLYKYVGNTRLMDTEPESAHAQLRKINQAVAYVKRYIVNDIPVGSANPTNLKALYWAIGQIGDAWGETGSPVTTVKGYVDCSGGTRCNYFVTKAYVEGAGVTDFPGHHSLRHPGLLDPLAANDLASVTDIANLPETSVVVPGTIAAFHSSSTDGHAALYLGATLYIYAGGEGVGKMGDYTSVMDEHDFVTFRSYSK